MVLLENFAITVKTQQEEVNETRKVSINRILQLRSGFYIDVAIAISSMHETYSITGLIYHSTGDNIFNCYSSCIQDILKL